MIQGGFETNQRIQAWCSRWWTARQEGVLLPTALGRLRTALHRRSAATASGGFLVMERRQPNPCPTQPLTDSSEPTDLGLERMQGASARSRTCVPQSNQKTPAPWAYERYGSGSNSSRAAWCAHRRSAYRARADPYTTRTRRVPCGRGSHWHAGRRPGRSLPLSELVPLVHPACSGDRSDGSVQAACGWARTTPPTPEGVV